MLSAIIKTVKRLLLTIISGILGIWLASLYIPGVEFVGSWKTLLLAGTFLGLINFFVKPILKFITTPLRILTLGLFGLVINMGIILAISFHFKELIINGIVPLFWTAILVWGLSMVLHLFFPKKKS